VKRGAVVLESRPMPSQPSADPPANLEPIARGAQLRREWVLIGLWTLMGAFLRFNGFGKLGLTHFDEGIYAIAGLWSVSPGGLGALDPQVVAYAPAGYPILIGLAYLLFGVVDTAVVFAATVCGVLTIPAVGWLGRRTFGPGAGSVAAFLAATSTMHVAFSRKGLTDAPFLLTWVVAIGLGGRFLESPRLGRALAFGLAVGLAQNVKYNGWLVGAIVIVAALVGLLADTRNRGWIAVTRTFGLTALAAVTAGFVYSPWFVFVERHGGYAALLRHHGSYAGGISSWLPHWKQQLAQVVALSGEPRTHAMFLLAAAAACTLAVVQTDRRRAPASLGRPSLAGPGLFLALLTIGFVPAASWWIGLAWTGWLLRDRAPAPRVLGSWWLILSLMTPFYHPYARLWLPIEAVGWLIMADLIVRANSYYESTWRSPTAGAAPLSRRAIARGVLTMLSLIAAQAHWGSKPPRHFPSDFFGTPTDGLRIGASDLARSPRFPRDGSITLDVLARRPLVFYLAQNGVSPIKLLPDERSLLEGTTSVGNWALVDEALLPTFPRILRSDNVPRWADAPGDEAEGSFANRWKPVEVFLAPGRALDPITLLDVHPAAVYSDFDEDERNARLILLAPPHARVRWFPNQPESE
jgi:dolichyl-phosphate-mannose-protein mannosyltransferase